MSQSISALIQGPIHKLLDAYRQQLITPAQVIQHAITYSQELAAHNLWITPPSIDLIQPYLEALGTSPIDDQPLWGVPFAIKDNIDLAGVPTTAACPAFAYTPATSASVVDQLINAGAIPIGKANLDQFATGLVGTRSPYGVTTHPLRPNNISGGSSSGSSIAVSTGIASFALGTDTAGSGRIPAALNGLVGIKPTRGLISNHGVVPACRSIDCVSIFAHSTLDALTVLKVAAWFDSSDAYARSNPYFNQLLSEQSWQKELTLGVLAPQDLEFFGDPSFAQAYAASIEALTQDNQTAIELVEIDFAPFAAAAKELYEGPWVTERYLAAQAILDNDPDALLPVTRHIIEPGSNHLATQVFESQYRLTELRAQCLQQLSLCDALLTPTAPRAYTVAEVEADPIVTNSNLGYYTNYMNLLDFCGIAIPAHKTTQGQPFGVTLVADRFKDAMLLAIASQLEQVFKAATSKTTAPYQSLETIDVVVCGAHMQDLPLNWQLTNRGGEFVTRTETAPHYKLYALAGGPPYRPGMIKDPANGRSIEVEVWRLPAETFASFTEGIPWPLGIGKVELCEGQEVCGFTCDSAGLVDATDISQFGGWRQYLAG